MPLEPFQTVNTQLDKDLCASAWTLCPAGRLSIFDSQPQRTLRGQSCDVARRELDDSRACDDTERFVTSHARSCDARSLWRGTLGLNRIDP